MKILHLIPSLDYCGAAAQLGLLSKHLPANIQSRICCLGGEGPWSGRLRQEGRQVDCLRWQRVFDPTPPWRLHRLLKSFAPDLVHVWGLPALRALGLVSRRWLRRTLVSRPLPPRLDQVKALDRWLLRRVRTVAAASEAEAAQCRSADVGASQLAVVPPGVEVIDHELHSASESAPEILCVGALEPRKGFRDAIWAFDILHFVFGDARLKIIGAGSERDNLMRFAAGLETTPWVDFLGRRDDVAQCLAGAQVCWVPTLAGSGRQAALEAMAAGCPVIASDRPGMRELIADGETGFVVPPGDKVAVCKRTRALFRDEALRRQIGAAGREHVLRHFRPETCAERWLEEYAAAA